MIFKRSRLDYGASEAPVTPYQKAAQVWDQRLGSARAQAKNWRLMALGSLGLAMGIAIELALMTSTSRVTPYVVEVERDGGVHAVAPALETYEPSDAQIANELAHFIENVRGISTDPVVVKQNWLKAYDYATDKAAQSLNDYARENDPFTKIGRRSVTVEVTSVVRASPSSFQLRWREKAFENGTAAGTSGFTGVLTIIRKAPHDAATLRANPLGLYVNAINWSAEFGTKDAAPTEPMFNPSAPSQTNVPVPSPPSAATPPSLPPPLPTQNGAQP